MKNSVLSPSENLNMIESYCELKHDETFIQYGCEILKPNDHKKVISFRPEIQIIFDETINKLY